MRTLGAGVLLLLAVMLFLKPESSVGLSHNEALMLWIVRDNAELEISMQGLRDLYAEVSQFVDRVWEAPPLYPVALDFWEKVAGESVYAVRWLSALFVLIGLSACAARREAWLVILAATPLLIYPATTAYGDALLFTLAALAWTARRTWLQVIFLSLAMLTDPFSGLLLLALTLLRPSPHHLLQRVIRLAMLPILFFAGTLLLFDVPFRPISLWMVALPVLIQLAAWGMAYRRRATAPATQNLIAPAILSVTFIGGIMFNVFLLQDHHNWLDAVEQLNQQRSLTDVTITTYNVRHPLAYYERHEPVRQGVSLDFGWRDFAPEEIDAILARIDSPIWLIVLQWQGEIARIDEVGGVQFGRLR